jgi:hypothetical protein
MYPDMFSLKIVNICRHKIGRDKLLCGGRQKIHNGNNNSYAMILKIFSPQKLAENLALFLLQNTANFCKSLDHNIGF